MEPYRRTLQELMERLIQAGWASSYVDKPGGVNAVWTPLGLKKLRILHLALAGLDRDPTNLAPEELYLMWMWASEAGDHLKWPKEDGKPPRKPRRGGSSR